MRGERLRNMWRGFIRINAKPTQVQQFGCRLEAPRAALRGRQEGSADVTSAINPQGLPGDEIGFEEKGDCLDDFRLAAPSAERC